MNSVDFMICDPAWNIGQPSLGIDPVELGGFNHGKAIGLGGGDQTHTMDAPIVHEHLGPRKKMRSADSRPQTLVNC